MTNRIWILGASDPEMQAIESLLRECGERVAHALHNGDRVTPASAYRATAVRYATDCGVANTPGETWYLVECDVETPACARRVIIDHHRPGDPGYGRPPSEFLEASSLGQVVSELAKTGALRRAIPKEHEIVHWMASHRDLPVAEYNEMLRTQWFWSRQNMPGQDPYASDGTIARGVSFIYDGYAVAVHRDDFYFERWVALIPPPLICAAAADHCLGAAYRGECPGVDPDALMRWRVESRARFQGRSAEEILADIARAREALRRAPEVDLAMCCYVRDLRDCHVPELPDAASRDGEAYLATVSVDGSGRPCRPKIVLGGATTPEMVRAFIDHWAPAHGLVDCYGDPERGFAGGYLPEAHP